MKAPWVHLLLLTLLAALARAQPSAAQTGGAEPSTAQPEAQTGGTQPEAQTGGTQPEAQTGGAAAAPTAEPEPTPRPAAAPAFDLTTPRQTVTGFLRAIHQDDPARAARYMDLRGLRWASQSPATAARQLAHVLERRVWLEPATLSDVPAGRPQDGEDVERIAEVKVGGEKVAISLARTERQGEKVWLFSAATVSRIPDLAAALGADSWLVRLLPNEFEEKRFAGLWAWQWTGLLLAIVVGLPSGVLLAMLIVGLIRRFTRRTAATWDDLIAAHARGPIRFGITWLTMGLFALSLELPAVLERILRFVVSTPLILTAGWLIIRSLRILTETYVHNVPDDRELDTRGLRTQVVIMRKLGNAATVLVTLSLVLMQFEVVRSVGWSLLASAGVAGVALGFAAQKSLGAVVSGLQLSVTQPIRLGDTITILGEWGTVEEITLTWARVKLWDERRLIVPVDRFLTEVYENWSRPGHSMTGIIEIAVDPSAPIGAIRDKLEQLAADHPAHDGRECVLQVIDLDERRALLRGRVSTDQVPETFAMRCHIREELMAFLQDLEGGRYLARQRYQRIDSS